MKNSRELGKLFSNLYNREQISRTSAQLLRPLPQPGVLGGIIDVTHVVTSIGDPNVRNYRKAWVERPALIFILTLLNLRVSSSRWKK